MSDFEKTQKLFGELGIGYKQYTREKGFTIDLIEGNEKIEGLRGANTTFFFNKDGSFSNLQIWDY